MRGIWSRVPGCYPPPRPRPPFPGLPATNRVGWGHDPRDSPRFRWIGSTSRCQTANCGWDWDLLVSRFPDSLNFSTRGATSQRYRALHDCFFSRGHVAKHGSHRKRIHHPSHGGEEVSSVHAAPRVHQTTALPQRQRHHWQRKTRKTATSSVVADRNKHDSTTIDKQL